MSDWRIVGEYGGEPGFYDYHEEEPDYTEADKHSEVNMIVGTLRCLKCDQPLDDEDYLLYHRDCYARMEEAAHDLEERRRGD